MAKVLTVGLVKICIGLRSIIAKICFLQQMMVVLTLLSGSVRSFILAAILALFITTLAIVATARAVS